MSNQLISGKIEGEADVKAKLESVPDKLQRKVMRKAMSKATKQTVAAVRQHIRGKSGTLRKAQGRKIKTYPKTMTIVAVIGARRGYGAMVERDGRQVYEDPAKIDHLVEFGTKPHTITVNGKAIRHPGAKAQPHMRPGYDETKSQVEEDFAAECESGLAAELKG